MTKRAFDKIMQGIGEARAYLEGTADKRRYRVHVPEKINVKKIRASRPLPGSVRANLRFRTFRRA